MTKHILNWKEIRAKNISGREYNCNFANILEMECKGTLLSQILVMPQQKPILFQDAAKMAADQFFECFHAGKIGYETGECFWYSHHFIEWITSLGYHIELTGDEFEPYSMTDKIC